MLLLQRIRSEPDVPGSTWEWQLWVKALWTLSQTLQRTIARSSYCGYMILEDFSSPTSKRSKPGEFTLRQQKAYSQKQSLHYAWICCCLFLRHEDMVHVPASQPGGACLPGERSPKFFNMSEKGHSFSKSLGGMALLKSPRTAHQGARFQAWKASPEVKMPVEAIYPLVGWGQALQGEMLDVWGRYVLGHQWLRETLLRGSLCRDVIVPCFLSPGAAARGRLLLCFKQLIKKTALKAAVCTLSLVMC